MVLPVRAVQKKQGERAGNEGILELTGWNSERKVAEQCPDP
jgi:hypothetical protein